jgi:hypothetical protein
MRPSKEIVERPAPKTVLIKGHAHLFTLLSVMWTAFSLIGVLLFREYREPDTRETTVIIAVTIWALHFIFIVLSIFFWITETPGKKLTVDCGDN